MYRDNSFKKKFLKKREGGGGYVNSVFIFTSLEIYSESDRRVEKGWAEEYYLQRVVWK